MSISNAVGAAAESWPRVEAGGEWLFPILALAVLSWSGAIGALAASFARGTGRTAVVLASLAGGASVLTLGASASGMLISFFAALEAMAHADPAEAPRLLGAAAVEASRIGLFGIGAGVIPLAASLAVFGVGIARLFLSSMPAKAAGIGAPSMTS